MTKPTLDLEPADVASLCLGLVQCAILAGDSTLDRQRMFPNRACDNLTLEVTEQLLHWLSEELE